ncbi:hypothetical protein E3O25_09640 [Cryobacterium sp. TMT1-3]|uniref:hypothetical protein n=1 Tax=Cryobacterium sp. TMT1-3 TaxID=1259237 RepID=UPI00106BDE5B|nr:hypothetical protein [Cryobacterium sp. TMT1-3]TFC27363.1 hypothetical protein E3O25_09640 [Cryobacterium sp. TMT1-3]
MGAGTAAAGGVDGAADECTPVEPTVPTVPATTGENATVDQKVYEPGQKVTATASGFGVGEQVQLVMFSEPALVGSFTADAQGQVQAVFPVDEAALPGTHAVQFTGWCTRIALTTVLVGSDALVASATSFPMWVWGAGGVVGTAGLALVGGHLLRVMRVPALPSATTTSA